MMLADAVAGTVSGALVGMIASSMQVLVVGLTMFSYSPLPHRTVVPAALWTCGPGGLDYAPNRESESSVGTRKGAV